MSPFIVWEKKATVGAKTGKEYARLVLEDFHGAAEAIVFPESWATLNQTIVEDACLLLTGGYSDRDRGEDQAPFVVESARPLSLLRDSGAVALALRWAKPVAPGDEQVRSLAALCAGHPGPAPVYIEWSDGNGESVRLRSRRLRVTPNEDLVHALRSLLGPDAVRLVKAGCSMGVYTLDYEKPLLDLDRQIEELKRVGEERKLDVSQELAGLQAKLDALRGDIYAQLTPMQRVSVARHPPRPYTPDYLGSIFTDFIELPGDRLYRDDLAIVGGWARIAGQSPLQLLGGARLRPHRAGRRLRAGLPADDRGADLRDHPVAEQDPAHQHDRPLNRPR